MSPPEFDWRDMMATAADPATEHRPTERTVVEREILRLHRTGLQPRDLATLFGMNDADVRLLIFGPDAEGTV
jgi:hypothetical protein